MEETGKKVNILLSSYNGEKYICEQIDSILNQTYKNIRLYVRDDGSTDGTLGLLEKYEKNGQITVIRGENIGYAGSFMHLLNEVNDGAYWSFSDQDDIWFPEKTETAVRWLEAQDDSMPLLYQCSYEEVDNDMNHILDYLPPEKEYNYIQTLTIDIVAGIAMVMNRKFREMMLDCNIDEIHAHDWWAALIAAKFGKFYFDLKEMLLHRRIEESLTLNTLKTKFRWFRESMKNGNRVHSDADEFYRVYGDSLTPEEKKITELFLTGNNNFATRMKKAFYRGRWRPTLSSELPLRFLMLFGKA